MVPNSAQKNGEVAKNSGRELEREVTVLNLSVHGAPASIHAQRPRTFREYKAYRFVREEKRGRDRPFPVDRIVYLAERLELTRSTDTEENCISLSGVDVTAANSSKQELPSLPPLGRRRNKHSGPDPSDSSAFSLDLSSIASAGEESEEEGSGRFARESALHYNSRSSSFRGESSEASRPSTCRSHCSCEPELASEKSKQRNTPTCCDLINLYVSSVDKQRDLTRFFRPCHTCGKNCCICSESDVRSDRPATRGAIRQRTESEGLSSGKTRREGPAGLECECPVISRSSCRFDTCCPEFFETDCLRASNGGECYCNCRTGRGSPDSSAGSDRILAYTSSLANAARSARVLARDLELVLSTFRNENEKQRESPRGKMSYLCGAAKYMPLILCVITPVSIFITYGIAVGNDHVSAFWPYISDTGTRPPESCIFGLLLSSVSFLLCAIIYLRYRQVSEFAKLNPSVGILPLWNRLAACFGFISALGLHMVANFQELNEFVTHIVGAMMCFFSAIVYFFLQTIFTRKMHPEAKCLLWSRITFTFLNVFFIVGTFAPIGQAMKDFKGDVLKWTVNDKGFLYHAISTFSEWLLVLSFCGYIATLHWEFRDIEIEPPQIKFLALEEGTNTEMTEMAEEGKAKSFWI